MNVVFWILQVLLGIKFISVAFTHGIRRDQEQMRRAIEKKRLLKHIDNTGVSGNGESCHLFAELMIKFVTLYRKPLCHFFQTFCHGWLFWYQAI